MNKELPLEFPLEKNIDEPQSNSPIIHKNRSLFICSTANNESSLDPLMVVKAVLEVSNEGDEKYSSKINTYLNEGNSFASKQVNKEGSNSQTEEKSFRCNECGKDLSRSDHLKIHMRIHTGEKPYRCKNCGKGFSMKFNLTRHMRTHTGEKPFRCKHCKKAFTQQTHLTKHMKNHSQSQGWGFLHSSKM